MDSQPIEQQKGKTRNKHSWTSAEDKKLVEAMVKLCVSGTIKSENDFKPGTFVQIEKLLEQKLAGSGIKANLHIESRVKTLKKQYNAISDMIVTSNGFSWDDEKKMIICEKELFEGWVKSHPAAKGMWMKSFLHYDNLGNVFGKDRANGRQAASATDYVDEIDINNDGLEEVTETIPPPVAPILHVVKVLKLGE